MSAQLMPDPDVKQQLRDLSSYLLERREAMLEAWRTAGGARSSLTRAQFNDHIPDVLDCFAHTIEEGPGDQDEAGALVQAARVCEHGMQRWQQGYQLNEVIREWGHLQVSVADELERYAASHPDIDPIVMASARRAWVRLCADGVVDSASEYWRLHQTESAGHVRDLEQALGALQTIEQSRAEGWRRAAHDLRGSLTVVKGATDLLDGNSSALPEPLRSEVGDMLTKSVTSLQDMLNDLLGLARLEAGHEQREITTFDAASLLRDFCTASQPAATDRGLFLETKGPESLMVEGDKTKVLRILQNLLLNALKYTQRGGVRVTWATEGRDEQRWTFSVQDTGPGIDEMKGAPLAQELRDATEIADETTVASTDRRRDIGPAITLRSGAEAPPQSQQEGEGVGLTIVKRLCELLDAGLELATAPGRGSTFRVILPRSYSVA
jgi:signal transduction histidine kinase